MRMSSRAHKIEDSKYYKKKEFDAWWNKVKETPYHPEMDLLGAIFWSGITLREQISRKRLK